jgi:hypothetical protein
MYFLSGSEILFALFGLGLIVWLAGAGLKSALSPKTSKSYIVNSPFLNLDVEPVSDGDVVAYAFKDKGHYTAHVENKHKQAKLDIEADSMEELRGKVESTFKAWAIVGKKKPTA